MINYDRGLCTAAAILGRAGHEPSPATAPARPAGPRLTAGAARGPPGAAGLPVLRGRLSDPPREVCGHRLADALEWRGVPGTGTLLAATRLHHSNEPYFAARLPFRVGTVALAEGAQALCHLAGPVAPGEAVMVRATLDRGGEGVLVVHARDHDDDPEVRTDMNAFTFPPRGAADRRVCRRAGSSAGPSARHCSPPGPRWSTWKPVGSPWNRRRGRSSPPSVTCGTLPRCGRPWATWMPWYWRLRVPVVMPLETLAEAGGRAASEAAVYTPLALAARVARPAGGPGGAVVQLASIFGRAHLPALGRESAVQAMALSAGEGLRARCHACGVRVLTVFAGPYGGPADLPLPAAAPARLARGVVAALEAGVEESAADPAAEDILARWREEPKVLERELAAMGEEAK
ncbi:MAG: SDR family oxidoreductase [Arhodomonas sp.]|nr:SDR family oxidoreductase [Arhodomonas sp.]